MQIYGPREGGRYNLSVALLGQVRARAYKGKSVCVSVLVYYPCLCQTVARSEP